MENITELGLVGLEKIVELELGDAQERLLLEVLEDE